MYKTIIFVVALVAVACAQSSGSVSAGTSTGTSGSVSAGANTGTSGTTSSVRLQFGTMLAPFRQAFTNLFSLKGNAIKSGTANFKSVLDQVNNATANIPGLGAFVNLGTSSIGSAVDVGSALALSGIETLQSLENTKMDMIQQGLTAVEGAVNSGIEMGTKLATEGMQAGMSSMNAGLNTATGLAANIPSASVNTGVSAST